MFKKSLYAIILSLFVASGAYAAGGLHIDGSSPAAANRSLQRMLTSLDGRQKNQLIAALAQLNKEAGASDAEIKKEGDNPTATRIKDKIAGLTAPEIIALAQKSAPSP